MSKKGKKLNSFYQGFRSEFIAQYILSNYALVTPVAVSSDIGIDSFCTLFKVEDKYISPNKLFGVQVKSANNKIIFSKHQIQYLCSLDIPLFLFIINKNYAKIDIYSMQIMKHFGLKYCLREIIETQKELEFKVELVNEKEEYVKLFNNLFPSEGIRWPGYLKRFNSDKIILKIPVLKIISNLEIDNKRNEKIYETLKKHTDNEYRNKINSKSYLPFMKDLIGDKEIKISYYNKDNYENQVYEKLAVRLLMTLFHLKTISSSDEIKDDVLPNLKVGVSC